MMGGRNDIREDLATVRWSGRVWVRREVNAQIIMGRPY